MRFFSPADITALTGTSPEKLRDWRRRGIISDLGFYAIPGKDEGTRDPNDPRLPQTKRWSYSKGDLLQIALVNEFSKFNIDLSFAFELSETCLSFVWAFLNPNSMPASFTDSKYMIAVPTGAGFDLIGNTKVQAVRINDLELIKKYIGSTAILIDFEQLALSMPAGVREHCQGDH